ncbi:MAG: PP2C family protein-serine/threonine phosphatase [Bacteroidales bacterium]|nr:PP2C family protein-serine/threonine phosphatase [Bacteroidales bacterium]
MEQKTKEQSKEDVLSQSRNLLLKPSKNTKRKILIALNFSVILIAIIHLITQITHFGHLPDPARDLILYPLIIILNVFSGVYHIKIISKDKEGNRFLNHLTSWASIIVLQILAIVIVHFNPNTANSFLFDFVLSGILIFICSTVLNKRVALIWFIIASISLYIAYENRGTDFNYHMLTQKEEQQFEKKLAENDPEALERYETLVEENKKPLPIKLYLSIWIVFLLLILLPSYFEGDMISNILKVIPTVVYNINVATEERNKLEKENIRLGMELDVAKRIQTMVLPQKKEIEKSRELDIGATMITATEVGGDFYEILPQQDGSTLFCIGDVTDHGLYSGIVMLMTQSVVRATTDEQKTDLPATLNRINSVLYRNIQVRLANRRNLTLSLLHYENGTFRITGQHEFILLLRKDSDKVEKIDTVDLGMYIGFIEDISEFVNETTVSFNPGDIMMLYTDGITESESPDKEFYGLDRLMEEFKVNRELNPQMIVENVIKDVEQFRGYRELLDDISLLVIKRV